MRGSRTSEKLQAIASERAAWISDLDARYLGAGDGITSFINIDVKRGRNFQLVAQLAYFCFCIPEQTPSFSKLDVWLMDPEPLPTSFQKDVGDVLREFWHIASVPKSDLARAKY